MTMLLMSMMSRPPMLPLTSPGMISVGAIVVSPLLVRDDVGHRGGDAAEIRIDLALGDHHRFAVAAFHHDVVAQVAILHARRGELEVGRGEQAVQRNAGVADRGAGVVDGHGDRGEFARQLAGVQPGERRAHRSRHVECRCHAVSTMRCVCMNITIRGRRGKACHRRNVWRESNDRVVGVSSPGPRSMST
ncbi:MAG: hypothetical protein WDN25_03010 [Acetobacteraceae bacterium]